MGRDRARLRRVSSGHGADARRAADALQRINRQLQDTSQPGSDERIALVGCRQGAEGTASRAILGRPSAASRLSAPCAAEQESTAWILIMPSEVERWCPLPAA